ncbi:MAG: hypothetical protein ABXS91_10855 [Sulfurimonas sp.]
MSIVKAVDTLGTIAGTTGEDFVAKITEWNKNKAYPYTPIHIYVSQDGVKDNSEDVGKITDMIESHIQDVIKNDLDLDVVENNKKTVAEIGKYLVETRKIQTSPLAKVTKNYTQHEAKFKEFNEKFTEKIDAIKEVEYKKTENAIKKHIEQAIEEEELDRYLNLDMFKDFVENKRKTKIFTTTGKLNKGIKDAAAEAIRVAYEPIKQEIELKERKQLQTKQFEGYLENIVAEGTNYVLEASISSLNRLKESVSEYYPDIEESCMLSIDNKIGRCEANIRANKAESEAESIKNADGEIMARVEEIKVSSQDMLTDIDALKEHHKELQGIYSKLTYAENQDKVKNLGASIKQRIVDMETEDLQAQTTYKPGPETSNEPEVGSEELHTYGISMKILEPLAYTEVQASSEEEAKEKLIERFKTHLSMVDLVMK